MRHRTPQFGHVFSGDGYSAGYYSYLWSDTLTADAWEAFAEGQGAWDKAVAPAPDATTSSRSATPSIRPTPTARSAARDAGIDAAHAQARLPGAGKEVGAALGRPC